MKVHSGCKSEPGVGPTFTYNTIPVFSCTRLLCVVLTWFRTCLGRSRINWYLSNLRIKQTHEEQYQIQHKAGAQNIPVYGSEIKKSFLYLLDTNIGLATEKALNKWLTSITADNSQYFPSIEP